MPSRMSGVEVESVQNLFKLGAMGAWTDGRLVAQFHSGHAGADAAFRVLVQRHGAMVMGVCERILRDTHLAEDAFQATFLVLVRKAGTLRDRDPLTGWLYGVALRVSQKARSQASRRRAVEERAEMRSSAPEFTAEQVELRTVLDEEILRLPEHYRLPLVLCYLEGLHHHEVAERLDCPLGTVESRLSRARERLRSRLERRGLAPTFAVLDVALKPLAPPALSASLVDATVSAAMRVSAGNAGAAARSAGAWVPWLLASVLRNPGRLALLKPLMCAGLVASGLIAMTEARSEKRSAALAPSRFPSAVATPLTGIKIDGRLDDWPRDCLRYRIRNQIVGRSEYESDPSAAGVECDAEFMVGYDPKSGLIYVAARVRDEQLVVSPEDPWQTDAMEIYVDGAFSNRAIRLPTGDWRANLCAANMPVLQYAALPGRAAVYNDPKGGNPVLVYGSCAETATKMRYRREWNTTIYEWAIQPFDHYPDGPTRLYPGKRIGFDVAIVDKDHRPLPAWFCWGDPPRVFKGLDAGGLGELILAP